MNSEREIIEEELVYGALRRERLWQRLGLLGIMFGLFVGGIINELYGWRMAFLIVGLPGVLLAIVFRLTVWEPPRGLSEAGRRAERQPSVLDTTRFLLRRRSFGSASRWIRLFATSRCTTPWR